MSESKGSNGGSVQYRPGDIVEVLRPDQIVASLGADGTLNGLPFTPEMFEFCGRKFAVSKKVSRTCVVMAGPEAALEMRKLKDDDVYFLESLRCSGEDHDDCDRGCMIFWKSAWLKKAGGVSQDPPQPVLDQEKWKAILRSKSPQNSFLCQSTQLFGATEFLSRSEKIRRLIREIPEGNHGVMETFKVVIIPILRKVLTKLHVFIPKGKTTASSGGTLRLLPGELVEIKSFREIQETLDLQGRNKGLLFIPDMKTFCGKRFRVRNRVERIILEQDGRMIEMQDTVILEGNTCPNHHLLGGCPRNEFNYWREAWLRRVNE